MTIYVMSLLQYLDLQISLHEYTVSHIHHNHYEPLRINAYINTQWSVDTIKRRLAPE
jgi:hypothetical protein